MHSRHPPPVSLVSPFSQLRSIPKPLSSLLPSRRCDDNFFVDPPWSTDFDTYLSPANLPAELIQQSRGIPTALTAPELQILDRPRFEHTVNGFLQVAAVWVP